MIKKKSSAAIIICLFVCVGEVTGWFVKCFCFLFLYVNMKIVLSAGSGHVDT